MPNELGIPGLSRPRLGLFHDGASFAVVSTRARAYAVRLAPSSGNKIATLNIPSATPGGVPSIPKAAAISPSLRDDRAPPISAKAASKENAAET